MTSNETNNTGRTAEQTTEFTYNSLRQLSSSKGQEGPQRTYIYYSSIAGSASSTPAMGTLIDGLKLPDGTALSTKLSGALLCPTVPRRNDPPVLGIYEEPASLPDGTRPPGTLQLFGYAASASTAVTDISPSDIFVMDGISVDTSKTPWNVNNHASSKLIDISLVNIVASSSTPKAPSTKISKTVTTNIYKWRKTADKVITKTSSSTETITTDLSKNYIESKCVSKQGTTSRIISHTISSALTGNVIREVIFDDEGNPSSIIARTYDSLGRITEESTIEWSEANLTADTKNYTTLRSYTYKDTQDGCQVTSLEGDMRTLTLMDGTQRPVRHELGTGDTSYILLSETAYLPSQEAESAFMDYFPGGSARWMAWDPTPSSSFEWNPDSIKTTLQKDNRGSYLLSSIMDFTSSVNSLGVVKKDQIRRKLNGSSERSEVAWLKGETEENTSLAYHTDSFDSMGLMTSRKEYSSGADSTPRTWTFGYDDFNRKNSLTTPDKSKISWTYDDDDDPISISMSADGDTQETVLGKADPSTGKIQFGSSTSCTWTTGSDGYITSPDGSRLYVEMDDSGSKATLCSLDGANTRKPLYTYAYTSGTDSALSTCLAQGVSTGLLTERMNSLAPSGHRLFRTSYASSPSSQSVTELRTSLSGSIDSILHPSGVHVRRWLGPDRTIRYVSRGHLCYLLTYDSHRRLIQNEITDLRTGHKLRLSRTTDPLGRETRRTYSIDGIVKVRYVMTWSSRGQLLKKEYFRNSDTKAHRTETYTYDAASDALNSWEVTGDDVKDRSGRALRKQTYTHDFLGNMKSVVSTFADGKREQIDYTYDSTIPSQRKKATITKNDETKQEIPFTYDANGNRTIDIQGRALSYDERNQLSSVSESTKGPTLSRYQYDSEGRLAFQWKGSDDKAGHREFLYHADALCVEISRGPDKAEISRLIHDEEFGLVATEIKSGVATTIFLLADPIHGGGDEYIKDTAGSWTSQNLSFTPYGESHTPSLSTLRGGMGYNGQRLDHVSGWYLAGHGVRPYSPSEMTFLQPDSYGPFVTINLYGYCGGDPVNRYDPSGHIMINRCDAEKNLSSLDQTIALIDHHKIPTWKEWLLTIVFSIVAIGVAILTVVTAGSALVFMVATAGLLFTVVSAYTSIASLVARQFGAWDIADDLSQWSEGTGTISGLLGLTQGAASLGRSLAKMEMREAMRLAQTELKDLVKGYVLDETVDLVVNELPE